MGKTMIGKLKEMLVLESEQHGEPVIIVLPKGCIIEVSSEEDYPSTVTDKDIQEAVHSLQNYDECIKTIKL